MKMDKLKKFAPILLLITLGATLAIANYENNLVNFVYDLADIQEIDRKITGEFFLENLPEFFNASVHINGSGYVGQIHEVSVEISQDRPDESLWLASGNFSVDLENNTITESIITGGYFTDLTNTEPYLSPVQYWTPGCSNGTYNIVMNMNNLVWTRGYIIETSTGPGGVIDPNGQVLVPEGGDQTFYIVIEVGYEIADVLVDGASVGPVSIYVFMNVQKDCTIHATFIEAHTITATAGTGGSIAPPGATTVPYGQSQEYTITPDSGYVVDDVLVDSITSLGPVSSHLFEDVTADHTIHASFVQTVAEYSSGYTYVERGIEYTFYNATYNGDANHTYLGGETINYVVNAKNAGVAFTELTYDVRVRIHDGTYVTILTGETNTYGTLVASQADFTITGSFVQPSGENGYWDLLIKITGTTR